MGNMMEKIKMMMMMKKMMDSKNNGYEGEYKQKNLPVERMSSAWESISQMRFKRQADDSLALNDRLKEKLEGMMKEHVHKVSNMTCVLRELNVIDYNNNVDLNALKEEYVPKNYNGPLKNLGKIKSFMNCCKSAKMKLCMYQDTKKKIEANFGPLEELLEGFNNQLTEEQVFFMVNELLQG